MQDAKKRYDLILMGASGFTGRLVAEHLHQRNPRLSWAIAGRDKEKLEAIRSEYAPSADVVICDSLSREDVRSLASSSKVVASTAGPFAKIGTPLVEACALSGTDYVDITGETQWIRDMLDAYHDVAQENGARIINCCGFDSLPSDLGTYLLANSLRMKNSQLECIGVITRLRGRLSGGTFASMQHLVKAAKVKEVARVLAHPFCLNPRPLPKLREPSDQTGAVFLDDLNMWTTPFLMAGINTRIVRRSEALRGYEPTDLIYHEAVRARNRGKAVLNSTMLGLGLVSQFFAPTRALSSLFLPKPGEGPTAEERQNGSFTMEIFGRQQGEATYAEKVTVHADSDPGYSATAKMLGESALSCLDVPRTHTGMLTPSVALGTHLIERLQAVGISFELTSV